MDKPAVALLAPNPAEDWDEVRQIFREYAASLDVDLQGLAGADPWTAKGPMVAEKGAWGIDLHVQSAGVAIDQTLIGALPAEYRNLAAQFNPQGGRVKIDYRILADVGVPGLRSIADVLFRKWLLDKGVNPARVTIVEAPFPQMKDLLKGGTIDAVAVLEPFRSRIVSDNTGFRLADYVAEVNPDVLGGVWIAQREWASANPRALTAFRESLAEAIEFIKNQNEEARAIESKYLGFSTPVLLPYSLPVSNADLETYVRYAREVGYLKKPVDVGQMLAR